MRLPVLTADVPSNVLGGVSIDGEKVTDIKFMVAKENLEGDGVVIKRGKKKFAKVILK